MAIYNEILAGRFARGVQRMFSMKGDAPVKQLAGEIIPVVPIEYFTALEHRVAMSVKSFANNLSAVAVAAQQSAIRMRNPAGSNVIAVIEKITVSFGVADSPVINRGPTGTADFGTIITPGNVRDVRMGPVGPTLILSSSTNAGAQVGTTWWQGSGNANTSVEVIVYENQELVIGPSDVMTLYASVVNRAIQATVFWRERALEESELQG